jgi:hypothetical protein
MCGDRFGYLVRRLRLLDGRLGIGQAASGINASAVSPVIIPVFIGSSLRLH